VPNNRRPKRRLGRARRAVFAAICVRSPSVTGQCAVVKPYVVINMIT